MVEIPVESPIKKRKTPHQFSDDESFEEKESEGNQMVIPDNGLQIFYKQTDETACAYFSMANALKIIGDEMFHEKVANLYNTPATQDNNGTIKYIIDFFNGKFRKAGEPKTKYIVRNLKNVTHDIMKYIIEENDYIKLIRFTGLHAVCIWRNYIIESNYDHTLPLNEYWLRHVASIGLAVSSTTELESLVKDAVEFIPPNKIMDKMGK